MPFATDLKRTSQAAQATLSEDINCRLKDAVQEQISGFQMFCQMRASEGYESARQETAAINVTRFYKQGVMGTEKSAREAVTNLFKVMLESFGFPQVTVWVHRVGNDIYCWTLDVSWAEAVGQDATACNSKTPAGTEAQCPICTQTLPAVVLVPCGHTVCHGCSENLQRTCPCCRSVIQSKTKGLFMEV
eukprot:TRINITY_DN110723_c0_g1_i1.p1 TRINITY_DN110723_c0_g1~~TRINITY_DN110723_c0_g1_i1.p1  ORF type:complete len:204 (-),score=30.25 TRINITY_DN110723_c0_g1_i1:136-702(-)